jgi:hypothetical protein
MKKCMSTFSPVVIAPCVISRASCKSLHDRKHGIYSVMMHVTRMRKLAKSMEKPPGKAPSA